MMIIEIRDFINPVHSDMYPIQMQFEWDTDVVFTAGTKRKSQRNQILEQPIRHWFINWDALKQAGRDKFLEIFNRAKGKYDTFLLKDRDDYLCSSEQIVTNGSLTSYQLVKTYYSGETEEWTENKKDIVAGSIYQPVLTHSIDGDQTEVQTSPPENANEYYLDDTTGIALWADSHPPSAGILTCTFQFYFRVRFDFDIHTDLRFLPNMWRAHGIHLVEDE